MKDKIKNPIIAGHWYNRAGDYYLVTGVDCSGKRFKTKCRTWVHAKGINVYRGSKWLIRNNQRFLISRHYN